ncbi:MAG: hypothetical protein HY706_16125 [Candidatus Hydrogenedentes bacterium]|nr:hypothetical protein [Candidatus Hydrogenedentota bacterium]
MKRISKSQVSLVVVGILAVALFYRATAVSAQPKAATTRLQKWVYGPTYAEPHIQTEMDIVENNSGGTVNTHTVYEWEVINTPGIDVDRVASFSVWQDVPANQPSYQSYFPSGAYRQVPSEMVALGRSGEGDEKAYVLVSETVTATTTVCAYGTCVTQTVGPIEAVVNTPPFTVVAVVAVLQDASDVNEDGMTDAVDVQSVINGALGIP